MTLGERCYAALVATGAHPFGEMAKPWADLPEDYRERLESTGRALDAATRADVVAQVDAFSSAEFKGEKWRDERWAVDYALDCVRMGRS